MDNSLKSISDKQPEWVWVIMSNDDLLQWLVSKEERQDYEKCVAIWTELDRRLSSSFVTGAVDLSNSPG